LIKFPYPATVPQNGQLALIGRYHSTVLRISYNRGTNETSTNDTGSSGTIDHTTSSKSIVHWWVPTAVADGVTVNVTSTNFARIDANDPDKNADDDGKWLRRAFIFHAKNPVTVYWDPTTTVVDSQQPTNNALFDPNGAIRGGWSMAAVVVTTTASLVTLFWL